MRAESVVRTETKYLITTNKKIELIKELKRVLEEDSFGKQGYYSVRSVYFDKPNFQDFMDKVRSIPVRKAIRLRIYTPYDKTVKLELKLKNYDSQEKISLKVDREDAVELLKKNYEVLKRYKTDLSKLFYILLVEGDYRPTTTITYDRKAFTCKKSKSRVTIDSNLQFSNENFDIYKEKMELNTILGINEHILEVKIENNSDLSSINEILYPLEIEDAPSSKYKRCCNYLTVR